MNRSRMAAVFMAVACAAAWWLSWPREVESHGTLTTTVLFDREIVRILNTRCVMCHSDSSVAFPLSTYEQTWVRGRSIRTEVLRRHMPPWSALPGYGQFANDNSLTLRELQFIVSWVEGLGPRNAGTQFLNVGGGAAEAPVPVRADPHHDHWQLGEPDIVRSVPATRVGANTGDAVGTVVVDLGLTSAQRIRAVEFLPSDRRVVRAAVFRNAATGQWLGAWTPWYGHASLPPGAMHALAAGVRVEAEIHFRGGGVDLEAGGQIGLFLADRAANRPASDIVLDARAASPGTRRRLVATTRLTADTDVWALHPRLGAGIDSIELAARRPDGGTDVLLFARDPSAQWPTPYLLKRPHRLQRGTELSFVAHYTASVSEPEARLTVSRY